MKKFIQLFLFTGLFAFILNLTAFGQQSGSIAGTIQDTLGAVVVGATVTVVAADGTEKTATSTQQGTFAVTGLAPGRYTVRVSAPNFALYENTEVDVTAGQRSELIVPLTVEAVDEQVEVGANDGVSTDPANNAGATVLKEEDLETLPDDPDELEAALQALAGPAAGPNGGQIYIDGFTGGRLPPKEAIREIRINQNPFSAEYDRLGFGRIEILTKPGADKFRGSVFGNFNDESLNARNPFATNRAPSQRRFFGGNVSGPIQKGRSSYFFDIDSRSDDTNAVVNARILDANLNPISFQEEFQVPRRRLSFSPRFDYAINDNNTLVARYNYSRSSDENQGISTFSLPSRAFETTNVDQEIRLTETMIINPTTVNETRFEYDWENREQLGDNTIPTISVADAFTGGGAQIGQSFNRENSWELQNYTTTSLGANSDHSVKFGVQLDRTKITDRSENGFGGTFQFINLDAYRDTILGTAYPTQFTVTSGNPEQEVSRTRVGVFFTDDWRVNPGLTLSFGLRYENQTNISDNNDFAPRFSFAWSPGAASGNAKTVFRGGFGVFYERFGENLTLQALRFNGSEQLNMIVNANDPDPVRRAAAIALLQQPVFTVGGVTNVPTAEEIQAALPQSNTIRTVSPEIKSPMMTQWAFGIERTLAPRTTLAAFYVGSRTVNVLRSRNINAPICPEQMNCLNAPRPDPTMGNIYQYESTGTLDQNRININFNTRFSPRFSIGGGYSLGFSNGDSDGANSFPAYSYDLSGEFGRTSSDVRHSFRMFASVNLPWGITANSIIIAGSGRPFNITRGIDVNGDALFTERPTFGELALRCDELNITASYCDVAGEDPNAIIPRYYGDGPGSFVVNLRLSKNFGFGGSEQTTAETGGQPGGPRPGGMGGLGGVGGRGGRVRMGGGGRGGFGGGDGRKPYNLNLGISFNNLFNIVNLGNPVGSLTSGRFGQSTSTGGGFGGGARRIELNARFSW